MAAVVLFVLVVELLNSAIEAVVDRVSLESQHLAKRAKDIGSAAVLGSLAMVAVVWAGVFIENFGWPVRGPSAFCRVARLRVAGVQVPSGARSSRRSILPIGVLGKASQNSTWRGTL